MSEKLKKKPERVQFYDFEEDSVSFLDVTIILARHLKLIIITPIILSSLMIVNVTLFEKPVFTSTSKIISGSTGSSMSQAVGIAAQFGISMPSGQSEIKWVYPEIIKSRTLARAVLKRKFNSKEFGPNVLLSSILTSKIDDIILENNLEIKSVDKFLEMISVYENKKTGILTLNVSASEPGLAKEINKVLIQELETHQKKYNKSKTSDTKKFIQERIVDVEKELLEVEENLKVFMDRNRRIENSPALLLEQKRLEREVTVLIGVFTTLKQQLETTKIEEVRDSDYVVVLDPPEIPLIRSKPNKKRMVIFSGVFGIGLGIFIGLIKEYIFNTKDKKVQRKINMVRKLAVKNILDIF